MARALTLGPWTLVAVETLTIPESLQAKTQELVGDDFHVLLIASHTHCAPDSQLLNDRMTMSIPGIATYSKRWLNWTAEKLAQVAKESRNHLVPLSRVQTEKVLAPFVRGRRKFAAPEAFATRLLLNDTPLDVFSAHPTLLDETELTLQGDWPGQVMRRTEGLMVTGALGDASPAALNTSVPARQQVVEFGDALSQTLAQGSLKEIQRIPRFGIVQVPLDPIQPHPSFAKAYGVTDSLALNVVKRFAPESATVHAFAFGSYAWVLVSGELSAGVCRRIEAEGAIQGFARTTVISHAGGWIGYVLEPEDYDRGGYEATLSFHGRSTSDRIVAAAHQALGLLFLN